LESLEKIFQDKKIIGWSLVSLGGLLFAGSIWVMASFGAALFVSGIWVAIMGISYINIKK
jgi:predicted phage tail protein|tara:strand:+ start:3007 stop:3186 length:180 start_codon:yes stop_codon:yes gene_type:complete